MKTLLDHATEIHRAAHGLPQSNYLIAALMSDGSLVLDEASDSGTHLRGPEIIEQISVQGGTGFTSLRMQLAMRDAFASGDTN